MGNSLSEEEISIRKDYLNKIIKLNFVNLDIKERFGSTDYLDFIKPEELGLNNIMSGYDHSSRPFVVFKAEIEFNNGKKLKTFSTFFQRYSNNNLTWHCCGHHGRIIIETLGGANNDQIKMLYELFESGTYKLNKDNIYNLNLNWTSQLSFNLDEISESEHESEFPKEIRIGYSN